MSDLWFNLTACVLIISAFCCCCIGLNHFSDYLNRQIYQDYQAVINEKRSFSDFKRHSSLKTVSYSRLIIAAIFAFAGVLFFIIYSPFTLQSLCLLLLCCLLVHLAFLDFYYYLTDIRIIGVVFLLSLSYTLFFQPYFLNDAIFCLLLSSLFFTLFYLLMWGILKKEGFGSGDIFLLLALSPLFEWLIFLRYLLFCCLSGIAFYLVYWLITHKKLAKFPFIPFMTAAFLFHAVIFFR